MPCRPWLRPSLDQRGEWRLQVGQSHCCTGPKCLHDRHALHKTAISLPVCSSGADAAAAGPRPPLVIVPTGAADLYADLFDSEGGGGSTLLKTQVAEVRLETGAGGKWGVKE